MTDQDGLEWVTTTFGLEPRWTDEPDIEIISQIARKHLSHDEEVHIDVTFHAQGAFNKLYKVKAAESECLMRVSLPVHPHSKTESEVATINFVRNETAMPVPRILAFDSDNKNDLGFEWILMEMMPGSTLRRRWRKMSWDAKTAIVRQLAEYQAQLHAKSFPKIGNLFPAVDKSTAVSLGPIVSLVFFWGDHLKHDVPRGPFETSLEWLQARLEFAIADQQRILDTSDDEDDIEDAEFAKELAEEIAQQLPKIFPRDTDDAQKNIIFHDDLSMQNILVDESGKLTAIIDWECVSAVPLWRACQFPQLLESRTREEEPSRDHYMADSDTEEQDPETNALDNEGINSLYWEHLLEYEQTQLRDLFMQEMAQLNSDWVTTSKTSALQADFEKAVHNCDNSWRFKLVRRWLDAYKKGEVESLAEKMLE
jgi:Ser/Thr protein kinase RdoA (MazF antagonist)